VSNALAIAGVSAVLKDLLDSGLIDHQVTDALGAGVTVSSLAPDLVPIEGDHAVPRLNLFLYQVTPNAAWRNVELPARDRNGRRVTNPPLALDLHYLLTAYGVAELQAEVLLGYGMQLLHENPVVSRRDVRTALNPSPVSGAILPTVYQALRSAELAEQVEMLKITPASLTTEEMSRLWSALTAHYRPTAAFQVSVVLIETQAPALSPLPVLTRGRRLPGSERDEGVTVTPGMVPPFPTLESALAVAHGTPSTLRAGDVATIRGHHLAGTNRAVTLRNDRFRTEHEILLPDSDDEAAFDFSVTLPANKPVGIYQLQLRVQRPGEVAVRTSNDLPVALAPSITFPPIAITRSAANVLSLRIGCEPEMRPGQKVTLLMDSREAAAKPFSAATTTLDFEFADAPPTGVQPLVRLKVDGVESVAVDRTARPPAFFDHRITLP
jgi:Pvc16 N-terminal domain